MIINFLYKMDDKNKRAITGMVVDDNLGVYEPLKQYDLILEDRVVLKDGQRIVSNYGKQYYGIISAGKKKFYFNMNDYMLTNKANLTEKVSYATTASKELLEEFAKNTNNCNLDEEMQIVEAGYDLTQSGGYKDNFGFFFRKVIDNVYCQFTYGNKPLYVGMEDDEYVLVDDFRRAYRVMKNEVRPLLVTRGFITSTTDKKTVAFSKFNIFSDGVSYVFGGENSFRVSLEEDVLSITKDFVPDNTYRLVNDERGSGLLKDICYAFKREAKGTKSLLKIGNLYASTIRDYKIKFVDNAALATEFYSRDIEILSAAYILFNSDAVVQRVEPSKYFCFIKEDNSYEISDQKLEYPSTPVHDTDYLAFEACFEKKVVDDGVLLTSVDKFVRIRSIQGKNFSLDFVDTGFDATIFSVEQADVLTNVLSSNFKRRELKPIRSTFMDYPVKNVAVQPLSKKYVEVLNTIANSSIRLNPYPKLDEIKTSSDKNSLEYLKALYPKCVMDAYAIFNLMLKSSPEIKNIFILGSTATCDIQGLAYACSKQEKEVNVWTSEMMKWGYLPPCELGDKVHLKNRYRLPFSSFPKEFLEQFDLIYFGKNFKDDSTLVYNMLQNLKKSNKKIYLANTNFCEIGNFEDPFYEAVRMSMPVNRKYNNLKLEDYGISNASMEEISYDKPMISNKISYQNVMKIDQGRLIDLFKKKTI